MKLQEMQHVFWRAVRFDPAPPEVDALFVSRGDLSSRDRMALYRRMYWYRQVDALHESFPILSARLGEEVFTKIACAYVSENPSEHHALERLGRSLPAFLRMRGAAFAESGDDVWADVAALEWAQSCALLAPDPPSVARLAELPFDRFAFARLELAPSVVTCRVSRDAADIVLGAGECSARCSATRGLQAPEGPRTACTVLVWRPRHSTSERRLEEDEASALALVQSGHTMARVCAEFASEEAAPARAASVLGRWIEDELVVRATVSGEVS